MRDKRTVALASVLLADVYSASRAACTELFRMEHYNPPCKGTLTTFRNNIMNAAGDALSAANDVEVLGCSGSQQDEVSLQDVADYFASIAARAAESAATIISRKNRI